MNWKDFWSRVKTFLALVLTPAAAIVVGWMTMSNTQLGNELNAKRDEIEALTAEVQRLETQLIPFKTIALERFGGTEEEALEKLAAQVEDLQNRLERAEGMIRRFGVVAVATISGDWVAASPPDYSNYLRIGVDDGGYAVKVQLQTNSTPMRFVEFTDTKKWRNSEGAGGAWVFENTAEAATGSWIFGTHRDDLQASCGNGEIVLLGVKPGVTKDNVITVGTITLLFHVNGVPSLRCKYTYNRATKIPDPENIKSPVTLRLRGPVTMENVP